MKTISKILGVFLFASLCGFNAFSCQNDVWMANFDADVLAAHYDVANGNRCVITASVNYARRVQGCDIGIRPVVRLNIIATPDLMSSGCPINGGTMMEGTIAFIRGEFYLVAGEVW